MTVFRVGVNASPMGPPPGESPARVVRSAIASNGDVWWAQQRQRAGELVCGLLEPMLDVPEYTYLETVGIFLHEAPLAWVEPANEPRPEAWTAVRHRVRQVSAIARGEGAKPLLPAAATRQTEEWLRTTSDAVWDAVDGVALHPYASSPREVLALVEAARELVPRGKSLHITEVGWAVDPGSSDALGLATTPHDVAEKLASLFRLLRENHRRLDLRFALVWAFSDYDDPDPRWEHRCGLLDLGGEPRPAYGALKRANFEIENEEPR